MDVTDNIQPRCFNCGHELIWNNSECAQEIDPSITDIEQTYNFYHCPHCGAFYSMLDPSEEDKNEYDFWKER